MPGVVLRSIFGHQIFVRRRHELEVESPAHVNEICVERRSNMQRDREDHLSLQKSNANLVVLGEVSDFAGNFFSAVFAVDLGLDLAGEDFLALQRH